MVYSDLKFISNNVKGIQSKKKRLKIIENIKSKLGTNSFLFLQETHSTKEVETKWKDDFKGPVFFSHGQSNARGVLISYVGNRNFKVNSELTDKAGRILILDVIIEGENILLINLYNPNTEQEQLKTIEELKHMLNKINPNHDKNMILGGDFNFFFNKNLESNGGKPVFKRKSVGRFLELKETFDLCDIWRIRNPKKKVFTFRQNHSSGFLQRRLDYFFVSNDLQTFTSETDTLVSISTDHSPILISLSDHDIKRKGAGVWKFNKSLLLNASFISLLKNHILKIKSELNSEDFNGHFKWEFLKYEIRKYTIQYSKKHSKDQKKRKNELENILKDLEQNLDCEEKIYSYNEYKRELDVILDNISEGIKIRSKCQWYEEGEKSNKFFLNLEKKRGAQGMISKILIDNAEITDSQKIEEELKSFYENLFTCNNSNTQDQNLVFLENISLPKLSENEINLCEKNLTELELFESLTDMPENKSPGNDGLTKEFYVFFWEEIKECFLNSIKETIDKKEFSVSQRQAIIKLLEKKDRDKRFIENWRPISLLNVDYKIISKALAKRLIILLPELISSEQTAYVKNRFIGESGRLISDIIEVTDLLKINGYLVTMDIEKAFDSLDHSFLLSVLKKFGFGEKFLNWVEIILTKQESCILNGGKTTQYFQLQRGARQGDPISAYLFILALEVLFLMIKNNSKINGLNIFDHIFLYTAYADDATFFLKDIASIQELIKVFLQFFKYSGLKPNISKCSFAGIGNKKGILNKAICEMKGIDLTVDTIKILGVYFSYNKKKMNEDNFTKVVANIQNILRLWRMRCLTLEGKITIFKSLAISKIVFLASLITIPNIIIEELQKIQNDFLWQSSRAKIKHETLCNDFQNGGLKKVDINFKLVSLQCSWIKRLSDNSFHQWKVIPKYIFKETFGNHFKLHSNLELKVSLMKKIPSFYKSILINWMKYFSSDPIVPSCILNQFIWYNKYIKVDGSPIFFKNISLKGINYLSHLINETGTFKTWSEIKREYNLDDGMFFQFMQITHSIPGDWKNQIRKIRINDITSVIENHHIIFFSRILPDSKLDAKVLYSVLINCKKKKLKNSSQIYYECFFQNIQLDWKPIYMLPRKTTKNTFLRNFQYKILLNILYLNKRLFLFGKTNTPLCSFCNLKDETVSHLFYECKVVDVLWNQVRTYFNNEIHLPPTTLQIALLGFLDNQSNKNFFLFNHILLIFKLYIYKSRTQSYVNLHNLINEITKIKKMEMILAAKNGNESDRRRCKEKWQCIAEKLF